MTKSIVFGQIAGCPYSRLEIMQGGKGSQKKGGSNIADLLKPKQPWERTEVVMQNLILIESFRRKAGRCKPCKPWLPCSTHEDSIWLLLNMLAL
jgi:hypothetical protein